MIYLLTNPYHSQRNNVRSPAETCQVTAAVMALRASGISFTYPAAGMQPEDYLAEILDSPEAWAKLKAEYPQRGKRPPREVHAILSWAINEKLAKRKVSVFTTRVGLSELLFRVAHHKAASLVSGRFTKTGHVVTLVGFESSQEHLAEALSPAAVDLSAVSRIFVDDPWGNGHSAYRDPDGNDVAYTLDEFNSITREYADPARKWAHLFDRDGIF